MSMIEAEKLKLRLRLSLRLFSRFLLIAWRLGAGLPTSLFMSLPFYFSTYDAFRPSSTSIHVEASMHRRHVVPMEPFL